MKPTRTLDVSTWTTPAHAYPQQKLGVAEISHYQIPKGIYNHYGVNGYQFFRATKTLVDVQLKIRRKVWMVSDPPHWNAMFEHARHYKGHVLCAGLGLGLIVHALNENKRVTRITVIELEQDVINLVGPQLPRSHDNIKIICCDFWEEWNWCGKYDGVFYDLFVGNGKELFPQAVRVWFQLHERFPRTTRRIHGFNNEQLESLDKLIERL